jgi:hypothetical protein
MKVEMGKEYTTRDGRPVRIYAVDAGGKYPVHGAHRQSSGTWVAEVWTPNGSWSYTDNNSATCGGHTDLIEVPRKFRLERWTNVYRRDDGTVTCFKTHDSQGLARNAVNTEMKCVACVRIVIECAECDGLTTNPTPENAQ